VSSHPLVRHTCCHSVVSKNTNRRWIASGVKETFQQRFSCPKSGQYGGTAGGMVQFIRATRSEVSEQNPTSSTRLSFDAFRKIKRLLATEDENEVEMQPHQPAVPAGSTTTRDQSSPMTPQEQKQKIVQERSRFDQVNRLLLDHEYGTDASRSLKIFPNYQQEFLTDRMKQTWKLVLDKHGIVLEKLEIHPIHTVRSSVSGIACLRSNIHRHV
jgi:hypothetical protein